MPAAVNQVNLYGHLPASPAIRREAAYVDFNLVTGTVTHRIRVVDAARAVFLTEDLPEGAQVIVAGAELIYDLGTAIVLVGPSASLQVAFEAVPVGRPGAAASTPAVSAPVVPMGRPRILRPVADTAPMQATDVTPSPPSAPPSPGGRFSQQRALQSREKDAPTSDRPVVPAGRPAARLPEFGGGPPPRDAAPASHHAPPPPKPSRSRAGKNPEDDLIPP